MVLRELAASVLLTQLLFRLSCKPPEAGGPLCSVVPMAGVGIWNITPFQTLVAYLESIVRHHSKHAPDVEAIPKASKDLTIKIIQPRLIGNIVEL